MYEIVDRVYEKLHECKDLEKIASELGVSKEEVDEAVHELEKMGLVRKGKEVEVVSYKELLQWNTYV